MLFLLHLFILLFLSNEIYSSGSGPVLIKMGDKKGGKKGGNLILISGGKCGSPTLIKGGGKKGSSEMILVGAQNNCEEKKQIHVVKQLVPIPYYIPKPVIKYILRHHYVPVRQVIMKPVPVPYPVKSYKPTYTSSNSYSEGDSNYGSNSNSYENGSPYGSSPYDTEGVYQSGSVGKYYSGRSNYDTMSYDDGSNGPGTGGPNPNLSSSAANTGYKRQSYDSTPYSVSPTGSPIMMEQSNSNGAGSGETDYHDGLARSPSGSYKSAATNNFFYESPKSYEAVSSVYGGSYPSHVDSITPPTNGNYHIYAPVYSGPNGQLFTTNQVFNDTNGAAMLTVSPSVASTSSMSFGSDLNSQTTSLLSNPSSPASTSPHDFLRIRENSLDRSSNTLNKKKTKSSSYKVEFERAKKLLTDQFASIATISNGMSENNK